MIPFHLRILISFTLLACGLFVGESAPAKTDTAEPATTAKSEPTNFAHQIYVDGNNAHVGIGTEEPAAAFDVYHGEIKVGSSGTACSAALAGAIRYADARLQLCDGTGWRNVSLDKMQ